MSEKYKKYKFLGYCLVALALGPIAIAYIIGFVSGCQIEIKGFAEVSNCSRESVNMVEAMFIMSFYVGPFTLLPGLILISVAGYSPKSIESPLVQKYEHIKNISMRLLISFSLFLILLFVLINTYKHFSS
jgi:hypothetical protein